MMIYVLLRYIVVYWVDVVKDTRISVYLGSKYYDGQLEGLCGNYNGKSSDDLGADTDASSITTSLIDQASAWKTDPSCPEPDMQYSSDPCEVCLFQQVIIR